MELQQFDFRQKVFDMMPQKNEIREVTVTAKRPKRKKDEPPYLYIAAGIILLIILIIIFYYRFRK